MGKIADRFAQKSNVHYKTSKDILLSASKFMNDMDNDDYQHDLFDKLIYQLDKLKSHEFQGLLNLIETNSVSHSDHNELLELIDKHIQIVSESVTDDNDVTHYLISIPLSILSKKEIWALDINENTQEKIAQILKDFDLIEDQAYVRFLPRILSPHEAVALDYSDIFKILQLLENGYNNKTDQAVMQKIMQMIIQTRLRCDLGFPSPAKTFEEDKVSTGVLVAYIASSHTDPFPLNCEIDNVLSDISDDEDEEYEEDNDDEDEDEDESANEPQSTQDSDNEEVMEDVMNLLSQACIPLASALNVTSSKLYFPPSDWYTGTFEILSISRKNAAIQRLNELKNQFNLDSINDLRTTNKIIVSEESAEMKVTFHSKNDSKKIDYLIWPMINDEDMDECSGQLFSLFSLIGLDPKQCIVN